MPTPLDLSRIVRPHNVEQTQVGVDEQPLCPVLDKKLLGQAFSTVRIFIEASPVFALVLKRL